MVHFGKTLTAISRINLWEPSVPEKPNSNTNILHHMITWSHSIGWQGGGRGEEERGSCSSGFWNRKLNSWAWEHHGWVPPDSLSSSFPKSLFDIQQCNFFFKNVLDAVTLKVQSEVPTNSNTNILHRTSNKHKNVKRSIPKTNSIISPHLQTLFIGCMYDHARIFYLALSEKVHFWTKHRKNCECCPGHSLTALLCSTLLYSALLCSTLLCSTLL